jgi:hypothetical protein
MDFGSLVRKGKMDNTTGPILGPLVWGSWVVPKSSMLHILLVGPGGGAPAQTGFGTGGAGSGSVSSLWIPTSLLPSILYMSLPAGGLGQAAGGGAGAAGATAYISDSPSSTAQSVVVAANGGNSSSSAGGGTPWPGGTGGSTVALSAMRYSSFGVLVQQAGQAGSAGSGNLGSAATDLVFGATGLSISGGTGAAVSSTGGALTGGGLVPSIAGSATTVVGSTGFWFPRGDFGTLSSGGTGAGGTVADTRGGDGGPGSGGGGSCQGNTSAGRGGNGGPAFVIFTWC